MREPMVTRTIVITKVVALGVDIETCESGNKVFILPRTYKDDKAIMKELDKRAEEENFKCLKICSTEIIETLYGMREADFIRVAKELPPRSKGCELMPAETVKRG